MGILDALLQKGAIPTPPSALNFSGITIPGAKPGSLESEQAKNSIFEQDMRGGLLPQIVMDIINLQKHTQQQGIPTPSSALNFNGITVPGLKPESLESDQALNAIFEQDMREGQSSEMTKESSKKQESLPEGATEEDIKFTMEKHNLTREQVLKLMKK